MNREKPSISASEINQYVYCHYQWYYGRTYGQEKLRELRQEYLAELGVDGADIVENAFTRGRRYHEGWRRQQVFRRVVRITLVLVILVALGVVLWQICGNGWPFIR